MLIDSHCHLDFEELNNNLPQILQNASNNGVSHIQTICTKISSANDIITISEKYNNIFCSVGTHPNNLDKEEISKSDQIIDLCKHKKVIGIGETGLDYYYEHSDRKKQMLSFNEHIIASQNILLPVIIHCRNAGDDCISILKETQNSNPYPALIHCFTESIDFAKKVLDLGLYISLSGIITFKNADQLRQVIKYIPLDRLLIETDSPYLAPVPYRGKINEPSYVKYTAQYLADYLNIDFLELANITSNNFFTLFQKAK